MESCCAPNANEAIALPTCPECGERGRNVDRITLKALLRPDALMRITAGAYLFCPTATCDVVYFATSSIFRRQDVVVPVFQKEPAGERTVCYCFAIGELALRKEIEQSGFSTAPDRITDLVKADRCACEVKNPQGTCCLGNVNTVVKDLLAVVAPAR